MSNNKPTDSHEIIIPLYNFEYNHSPFKDNTDFHKNSEFVGRKKQVEKFLSVLQGVSKTSGGGAYLIAGYRGAGKTSFVNKVLRDYKKEKKDALMCELT